MTVPEDHAQTELVSALESGAAVGHHGRLRQIVTGISRVFLSHDRAYKLKRAVTLPFVDLSTLDLRRRACEAELEINRKFAPGMYLGLEPVILRDGAARVGGEGDAVDWIVIMRRFADDALFSQMAADDRLDPHRIVEVVERLCEVHQAAPPVLTHVHAADYGKIARDLRTTELKGAKALGIEPGSPLLFERLEQALAKAEPLIEARRAAGFVKRGHGDLHLSNICLFEGRATPFDAMEFDAVLATTDTLYDLAFLLMDLRRRGLTALANLAMNTYFDSTRQPEESLALLPVFMALRATVRMAVAMDNGDPAESEDYRQLGLACLAQAPAPRLIAVGGLSGTGKSVVAQAVAPRMDGPCGARLLRTDVLRKAANGVSLGERLGAEHYSKAARAEIYDMLLARTTQALAAGCTVVADATFAAGPDRAAWAGLVPIMRFQGLWLAADRDVRLARVAGRTGDASDATVATAAAQIEPTVREAGWETIDANAERTALIESVERRLNLPR